MLKEKYHFIIKKTIVCWNCQAVMMVKDEWNMVQCTNCDKINRIPNVKSESPKQDYDELNHFDISFPYVV